MGIKREAKEVCEGNKNELREAECCDCGREEGGGEIKAQKRSNEDNNKRDYQKRRR